MAAVDDAGTDGEPRRAGLQRAAAAVGDRWTLLVVDALLGGPGRYSDLEEQVAGISPTVLSARLKELEAGGLVVATPYQDRPVRHEYRLTDRGRSLASVLDLLAAWGDEEAGAAIHQRCGTALTAVPWCPTCEESVADADEDLIHL